MFGFAVAPVHALLVAWLQAVAIPAPTGLVNDFAGVIPADRRDQITRLAEAVRASSPGEIAVVILADIGDRDPSEIALRIGREWAVGKAGAPGDPARNAGVVILVVPKETSSTGRGQCRVEVGRGAEGFLTDATVADMCREATPAFIARDYGAGVTLITARVAQRFATEFGFSVDSALAAVPEYAAPTRTTGDDGFPWWLVVFVIFMVMSFAQRAGRRGRRGRRGGRGGVLPILLPMILSSGKGHGFGGGGFGGFSGGGGFGGFGGGGGFSGGGGGSSW